MGRFSYSLPSMASPLALAPNSPRAAFFLLSLALAVLGCRFVPGHLLSTESEGPGWGPGISIFTATGPQLGKGCGRAQTPYPTAPQGKIPGHCLIPSQLCPPRGDRQSDRFIQVSALMGANDLMCCPFQITCAIYQDLPEAGP